MIELRDVISARVDKSANDYNNAELRRDAINMEKARQIKAIATDVDGVLTDGALYIDENAQEPLARFSIYDGMGVSIAHACGLKIFVISGRKSLCTEARCRKININEVHTGIENKRHKLREIASKYNLSLEEIAYIGDDIVDLAVMSEAGLKVTVPNGVQAVKRIADFVTMAAGGHGALRELIEYILDCQGKYAPYIAQLMASPPV